LPVLGPVILQRRLAGNDFGTPLVKVSVTHPAMILATGIDDLDDGLVGNTLDQPVDFRGAPPGSARVDEHHALRGHDESEGRIVAEVLGAAISAFTDDGVDLVRYRPQLQAAVRAGLAESQYANKQNPQERSACLQR